MDIKKEYSCLERNSRVFQKNIEIDEDYQETIPQYCDDIYRIVKCKSHSYITSVDTNYSEIKIFGKTEICITYFNENSDLCYTDFEEEFTKTCDIENLSDKAFARANICDKYTNFRVINQRRIDIHTSGNISLSVYDRTKCPGVSSCENAKLRVENVKTAMIINTALSRVEFDEEFSIPADSQAIKRIISSTATASLSQSKIINDKALVKSIINLSVMYTTDESPTQIKSCKYSFEVSKIIDAAGIRESDYIIANINVGNLFTKSKNASGDKLTVIEAFGELCVSALFIREEEQSLITDGYVLNRNSDCVYTDYRCCADGKFINENRQQTLTFDFSNDIKEIKELSISLSDTVVRNSKLVAKATANAICVSDSDNLTYFSNTSDIEISIEEYQDAVCSLNIQDFDFTLSQSAKVDVRLNYNISAYLFNESSISILSDLQAEDEFIKYPTMTVYFGKEEESVWSIAKNFSSDIDLILKENNLTTDILDANKVLLIPGV